MKILFLAMRNATTGESTLGYIDGEGKKLDTIINILSGRLACYCESNKRDNVVGARLNNDVIVGV